MGILIQYRNLLLFLAAIGVLCAIPLSEQLVFDQRIESFFAEDNPDLILLNRSRSEFGGDEFVLVAWTEDRLLDVEGDYPADLKTALVDDWVPIAPAAEKRIRSTAEKLNGIKGINAEKTQHLPGMLEKTIRFKNMKRAMVLLFEGTLIGRDARTTGIIVELLPEEASGVPRGNTIDAIREVAATLNAEVAVAGEPVQVYDMFQLVEQDSRSLFLVSLAILSVVLLVMFHGLRWLLAPIGLVLGAVLVTRATLQLQGAELSMVSSMLNSLVTVIGIATFMHVIVHYRDLRNAAATDPSSETDPHQAARQTLRDMASPVFWTCATTAVGFGSLLVSQITPVRSFSVMMCLATFVVLAGCFVLLPATLASGSRLRSPATVPLEHWLDRALQINCRVLEQRPVATAIVCLLLLGATTPGVFQLTLETDFSRNFKDSSEIVRSLRFVESRLGGAGSWEVAFDTPETLDNEFLNGVHDLTTQLREQTTEDQNLTVLSLTDMTSLPPRFFGPKRNLDRIQQRHPELVASFYNIEKQRMRIVLRSAEQQPADSKEEQIRSIRATVEKFFAADTERRRNDAIADDLNPDEIEEIQKSPPSASGMFVLLAAVIQSLLSDQLNSFLVATGGIFLCMTIAFRSLRIGLISLLPNVFPVALVMGSLGWLGTRVNIGTAMITSVSMGLTVDSTIHYITAFERARRTMSVSQALHVAHAGAGRAVVFAHLALIAGFLVLTASRFVPLVYFGGLLTLSLLGGIFGDLVLLPLLLRWTSPASAQDTHPDCESDTQEGQTDE